MTRVFKIENHHSEIISKSTLFKVLKYIDTNDYDCPVLLLDSEKISSKVALIGSGIDNSKVFYAVKANPSKEVLTLIDGLGLGFEVASEGELNVLAEMGISPERIITSNPIKSSKFLKLGAEFGLTRMAFDSRAEVDKIAKHMPEAGVYVRLSVPNEGSEWPLSKKFGVEVDEALSLLLYARDKGIDPMGVTFHVGSQCTNKYNWDSAIYKAAELWSKATSEGLNLRVLNIGGGYPINYTKGVVGIQEIEQNINSKLKDNFPKDVEILIEPGRSIVGDAGVMLASVIGKAKRGTEDWLYIDVGVFNGLMESIGGIKYSYMVEAPKDKSTIKHYIVGGPSCDSFDVMDSEVKLPEPEVGSLILVLATGAYTVSYGSEFNGFAIPETILI